MNPILQFYPGDVAVLFGLNILAQVTVAGFLVWLAMRFIRPTSAPIRHGVCFAALTWILISPLAVYVFERAGVFLVAIPVSQAQIPSEPKRIVDASSDARTPENAMSGVEEASLVAPTPMPSTPPKAANPVPAPQANPGLSWVGVLRCTATVAFLLWASGVVYFLARFIHGLRMLATLGREVRPIHDERIDAIRAQACQALGVAKLPLLVESRRVGSPIAVGIFRPMVVVPADIVGLLDERQLRDILIHECAHLVRRDHVVGLLQRLAEMLCWPHPLVHFLNRELAIAREEICDNHVLTASNGPDYARTLLALAECATDYHATPATSGLLGPHWRLEDRVVGLLNQGRNRMIRMNRILAAAVAVLFMTTALVISGTRLIGADAPQAPNSSAQLASPDRVPLVPERKEEKPMPPASPPTSEAVIKDGLSITIAPAKAVFPAKEPLAFVLTLKNRSKEPFMLFDAEWAMGYPLEIKNASGSGPWFPSSTKDVQRSPVAASLSRVLKPGASLEIKAPLDDFVYAFGGPQNMTPRPLPFLEPGKYSIRATRRFTISPVLIAWPHKHWLGTIATKPVEFIVAAEKPAGGAVIDKNVPDVANGLSISVKPAKAVFPEKDLKDLLTFTVIFKNVSKKTLLLYDIDETMGYKVEFNGIPAGGPWVPRHNLNHQKVREAPKVSDSRALAPGASLQKQVVMNGVTYDFRGVQPAKPVARPYLEAGKYRVTVGFKGVMNPAKAEWKDEHWIGEIAGQSPEFTIADKKQAGAAIVVKGLSVAATTEHRVFPGNVIPHFKVRIENVSGKDLSLFNYRTPNWTLHIKNKATGQVQTWKHTPLAAAPVMTPLILAAGKSHEEEIVLHPPTYVVPPKNTGAVAFEPGNYEVVCEIELREAPNSRAIVPAYWVGQVCTAPLEFTVGDGTTK